MDTQPTRAGRGGYRAGAGRPKGAFRLLNQTEMKAPADLDPEAARIWRRWSKLALRQRTLTRETAPAFALICSAAAELATVLQQRADPIATAQLCRLVFDGLVAFRLAPEAER